MRTSVLSKVGYSGRRANRDQLLVNIDAYVAGIIPALGRMKFPSFKRKKLEWHEMTRYQKAQSLARQMGYSDYSQCRHRVDDILAIEE